MTFDEYQIAAAETAVYPRNERFGLTYTALGLASEAGEVAGKVKKMLRDAVFSRDEVRAELGDVLWYVAMLAKEIDTPLSEIADANISKLRDRKERNAILGNGDNR